MKQRNNNAFTMIEIMVVLAVIAIIVAIAAPTWFRQREITRATSCQENLAKIDHAIEQWALEYKKGSGASINYPNDLLHPAGASSGEGFLRSEPTCPAGGTYACTIIGEPPTCSIGANNDPFAAHVLQN